MNDTAPKYGSDNCYSVKVRNQIDDDYFSINSELFTCGNKALDGHIEDDVKSDQTVSYCYIDTSNDSLVAYASLECSQVTVSLEEDNREVEVPCVEIVFFATKNSYHGLPWSSDAPKEQTFSVMVLSDLLRRIAKISQEQIGARWVVLSSLKKAQTFYRKCGFEALRDTEHYTVEDGCVPMVFRGLSRLC